MAPKDRNDWQLECGQIRDRAGRILKMEQWTDSSFLVGARLEQVEVKTHKLILAMASPVFEAMFYGPIAEGAGPITIPDMEPAAFKALIEYVYTDNIELNSSTMACNLYYGAQKYMLPQLQTVCTTYLSCNLNPETVCSMYEFALLVGEEKLLKDCEQLIQTKTIETLNGSSFLDVELDTVVRIFSLHPMNVDSELELVRAAEKYDRAHKKAKIAKMFEKAMDDFKINIKFNFGQVMKNKDSPQNDLLTNNSSTANEESETTEKQPAETPETKLNGATVDKETESVSIPEPLEMPSKKGQTTEDREILKVLHKINFLTLSPLQLAEEKSLLALLTPDELLAIVMNSASINTFVPMPPGFSRNRLHRKNTLFGHKSKQPMFGESSKPAHSRGGLF